MLAHRTAVAQIMVAAEQMSEEFLTLGPPHQADFQRPQRRQGSLEVGGIAELHFADTPMRDRVIDWKGSLSGQLDMPGSMQRQHQSSADHVAGLTIGLNPVPGFANFDREAAPA